MQPQIHIIAGPTASGKSAVALDLAEKTGGVIINADSQQMYAELRILTARPSPEEEARAPHRLYGTLPAAEACSVGKWLKFAKMEIDWALAQAKPAIVVGGTGLYLRALTEGLAEIPHIPAEIRAQATADLEAMGNTGFHARLAEVDPQAAKSMPPANRQRLIRAWEVWLGTGKTLSWWLAEGNKKPYEAAVFDVKRVQLPREELYARCDARFDTMIAQGAVEEVKQLLALNLSAELPAMRVIGVPELSDYIKGEIPLEVASEKARQATRNYAKRQMTWFRNQMGAAS